MLGKEQQRPAGERRRCQLPCSCDRVHNIHRYCCFSWIYPRLRGAFRGEGTVLGWRKLRAARPRHHFHCSCTRECDGCVSCSGRGCWVSAHLCAAVSRQCAVLGLQCQRSVGGRFHVHIHPVSASVRRVNCDRASCWLLAHLRAVVRWKGTVLGKKQQWPAGKRHN